ncbi:MAG: methionine synthase [Nitrospirota bacterium]|nr:methionine synthase [Nitrospirota bacterium]
MSRSYRFATAIGSLPVTDSEAACDIVLNSIPSSPGWPQLPNRAFEEGMYQQFLEGIPGVVFDREKNRISFDTVTDREGRLLKFFERYVADNPDDFALSEKFAAGFYTFVRRLEKGLPAGLRYLKGHVTGPISYGLGLTDQDKKLILYDPEFIDAIIKGVTMNARWQVRQLKRFHPDVIIFIDEPYLVSFGSAYVSLSREDVIRMMNEVVAGIHAEGALAGMHCCGNTDWSLVASTDLDIINFDAYNFSHTIALYPEAIGAFLARGGVLAWGIVPTAEEVMQEDADSLFARLEEGVARLIAEGLPEAQVRDQLIITPSCGTGSLTVSQAEQVFRLLREVAERLQVVVS